MHTHTRRYTHIHRYTDTHIHTYTQTHAHTCTPAHPQIADLWTDSVEPCDHVRFLNLLFCRITAKNTLLEIGDVRFEGHLGVCVCVCVRERERESACVSVCVRERERERERQRERERERAWREVLSLL